MMCEECFSLNGKHQARYFHEKTNSDFCPTHGWKKREPWKAVGLSIQIIMVRKKYIIGKKENQILDPPVA